MWGAARKACLTLVLETASRPYLAAQGSSSGSPSLAFDYSTFTIQQDLQELTMQELHAELGKVQQEPAVCAAYDAVAVAVLLAANNIISSRGAHAWQLVQQQLQRQRATDVLQPVLDMLADDDDDDDGSSVGSEDGDEDDWALPLAEAAADAEASPEAGLTEDESGPSHVDLLRVVPAKLEQDELLVQLSFQLVMAKELLGVSKQLPAS